MANMEKTIQQAIKCLNVLVKKGLVEQPLTEFKESCKLNYSERQRLALGAPAVGILYWVDQATSVSKSGIPFAKVIAEFEHKYNALVYHATHEFFEFGECLSLFYVSDDEEEWEDDLAALNNGATCAYVVNFDDDTCSEFGWITFMISGGGVVRTS